MRRVLSGGCAVAAVAALAGCGGDQSTLSAHSDAAHSIATLWWVLFALSTIVVTVVTLLVCLTFLKRRGRLDVVHDRSESPRARNVVLLSGAVAPAVILVALFAYVLTVVPATAEPKPHDARMEIDVTGRQWFWDVSYPAQHIRDANEIHIPTGVPVRIRVHTNDVIHSFWVPELNRKIDMIPGHDNSILLQTDRAGVYRGQCAEFCGLQHANMAFYVVAQGRAEFDRWLARANQPAEPASAGARVFTQVGCAGCHTIAGISDGRVGPDLTHVGSRLALAAGTLTNNRAHLRDWIREPQHLKPGSKMPALPLTDAQVRQLAAYLESRR